MTEETTTSESDKKEEENVVLDTYFYYHIYARDKKNKSTGVETKQERVILISV